MEIRETIAENSRLNKLVNLLEDEIDRRGAELVRLRDLLAFTNLVP
jgi:hypothetical protein